MFSIKLAGRRILFTEMQDTLEAINCSSEILWKETKTTTVFVAVIPASTQLITFMRNMIRSGINIHYSCCEADIKDIACATTITRMVGGSSVPLQRVTFENWRKPIIVTSNKPIGLIATLVALGIGYPGIRHDLSVLIEDSFGELSDHAKWLIKKWGSTPSLVMEAPEIHDDKIKELFCLFLERIGVRPTADKRLVVSVPLQVRILGDFAIRIDGAHQINH